METTEQILTRQHAEIKFRDGMVKYFSISTQHGQAKTMEEAINNIIAADKKYDGKTPLAYVLERKAIEESLESCYWERAKWYLDTFKSEEV